MRRRIAICGVSDETLGLVSQLLSNPEIEIAQVFDPDPRAARKRLAQTDPRVARPLERILTGDLDELLSDTSLAAVVAASPAVDLGEHLSERAERDLQVVSVLAARMLWGYDASAEPAPEREPVTGERGFAREAAVANVRLLTRRAREEISRAGAGDRGLVLASARIENLREIERHARPGSARRVIERVGDALRAHSRDPDVIGRLAEDEFMLLLPDAGPESHAHVVHLVRAVARDVCGDEALNDPVRVSLAFGYASHSEHGGDADALIRRAREPRIRTV